MHLGVPPGGALVPSAFEHANALVQNACDTPALEIVGRLVIRAEERLLVAHDHVVAMLPGGELSIESDREHPVRYLAVRGGIDVPSVLGGRGTLAIAQLGGYHGRPLRRGDVLSLANGPPLDSPVFPPLPGRHGSRDSPVPLRYVPWPESNTELAGRVFAFSPRWDRTGVPLLGEPLASAPSLDRSIPMVAGAIQLPPNGLPVVLGRDHPTTGGYPVLGAVVTDDVELLFSLPRSARLTFTKVVPPGW